MGRTRLWVACVCVGIWATGAWVRAQSAPQPVPEPPAPVASPPVRMLLEDAGRLTQSRSYTEALAIADRAVAAAAEAQDVAGRARAQRERAVNLEELKRIPEAQAAWKAAAECWQQAGYGPGQVEALVRLVRADEPAQSRKLQVESLLKSLLELLRREASRPAAVAISLVEGAIRLHPLGLREEAQILLTAGIDVLEPIRPLEAARQLNGAGTVMTRTGDFARAQAAHERALKIQQRDPAAALDSAGTLNYLGGVAMQRGDPRSARRHLEAALSINERHAPGSTHVAASLNQLTSLAYYLGDLPAARGYAEKALAIQAVLAPDSAELARCLSFLAVILCDQGELTNSRRLQEQALALREKLSPGSRDVAESCGNMAVVLAASDDLEGAEAYQQRSVAILERIQPGSLGLADSLGNLAALRLARGDAAGARAANETALGIATRVSPDSLVVGGIRANLGAACQVLGRTDLARDHLNRALEIFARLSPESLRMAFCLGLCADLLQGIGDLQGAATYAARALRIREKVAPNSPDVADSLVGLGSLAEQQRDFSRARQLYARALDMYREINPRSRDVATCLNNLGSIAAALGETATARANYEAALSILEKEFPGAAGIATCLTNLGSVMSESGDIAAAQPLFERALALRERAVPGSLEHAQALNNLGVILGRRGNRAGELARLREGWAIVRRQGELSPGTDDQAAFSSLRSQWSGNLALAEEAAGNLSATLRVLEEGRAQGMLRLLSDRRTGSGAPEARRDWERAAAKEQRAEALVAQVTAAGRPDPDAVQRAREAYEDARRKSAVAMDRLRALVSDPATQLVKPEEARRALGAGDLFVAYALGANGVLILAVDGPNGAIRSWSVVCTPARLAKHVALLQRAVTAPIGRGRGTRVAAAVPADPPASPRVAGAALARLILPTELSKLLENSKRIIISPDGALWNTPWAALPLGAGWLGQRKPMVLAPSLSIYAVSVRGQPTAWSSRPRAVVVGDCLFDGPEHAGARLRGDAVPSRPEVAAVRNGMPGGRFPRLPATRSEAMTVAALYGTRPLLGRAATESGLRRTASGADMIHVATHGVLHAAVYGSSGLVLTPGDGSATDDDGALQAWEFVGPKALRLRAQVVVLSACQTGLGEYKIGEGVMGLTRALQLAGARSVVASQWSVADQSTARLMVSFHRGLRQGLAKDEALRRAMIATAGNPRWSHPAYWAPFYLTGDPRRLGH